jgi:hypothetical protein
VVPIRHGREEQSYRRAPKLRQARRESRVQNREIAIKTDAFDSRVFHDALVLVAGSIGIVPSEHLGKFSAYAIRQFTHRKSSGRGIRQLYLSKQFWIGTGSRQVVSDGLWLFAKVFVSERPN